MNRYLILVFFAWMSLAASAQTDRDYIRSGNKFYRTKVYDKAEVDYRKALEKNGNNPQAHYNLGTSLLQQHKDSAAVEELQKAARIETNPRRAAMIYHNIGVVCQENKMFAEAIDAYKQSLRCNPYDDQARYNLELCKRQKKDQKSNQNQNGKDNKQDQQKKDEQKKDEQQQQQKQDENKQQEKPQPQEQKEKMSKENAERLLNAAMQQEKATQERMNKMKQQPQSRKYEKNW